MSNFKNISKRFLVDFCNDCSCATITLTNDRRNIIDVISKLKYYITSGVGESDGLYSVSIPNGCIYAKGKVVEVIAIDNTMACIKFNILNANRRSQVVREVVETIIYYAMEQVAEDFGDDIIISSNLCYLDNSIVHETIYCNSSDSRYKLYWAYSLGYFLGKTIDLVKKDDMAEMTLNRLASGADKRRLTWLHHVLSGINMNLFNLSEVLDYTIPEHSTLGTK